MDFNEILYEESKVQGDFLALEARAGIKMEKAGLDKNTYAAKIAVIKGMNTAQIVGFDQTDESDRIDGIITYRIEGDRANTSKTTVRTVDRLYMKTGYN